MFFYQERPKSKSYWFQIEQDNITINQDSCFEEGLFFAKETEVIHWFKFGDTLAEIIFDPSHASYSKLDNQYFESTLGICGKTIFATNFISMNSDEMFQFIKKHYDSQHNGIKYFEEHLIYMRAFDTLEKLWEYKYSLLGDGERTCDLQNAIDLLRIYALNPTFYRDIDVEKVIKCNNWNELLTLVSEDQWTLFEQ